MWEYDRWLLGSTRSVQQKQESVDHMARGRPSCVEAVAVFRRRKYCADAACHAAAVWNKSAVSPSYRVEVDADAVRVNVSGVCRDRSQTGHDILDVGSAGPGVDGKAPAPPSAHALDDVRLNAGLQVSSGPAAPERMGLDDLRGQACTDDGTLEGCNEPRTRCAHVAARRVGGARSEVEEWRTGGLRPGAL